MIPRVRALTPVISDSQICSRASMSGARLSSGAVAAPARGGGARAGLAASGAHEEVDDLAGVATGDRCARYGVLLARARALLLVHDLLDSSW